MSGDIFNHLGVVRRLLGKMKYQPAVDLNRLLNGEPESYLPIFHFAFLNFSSEVARFIVSEGYELFSKNDLRFTETMFKLVRGVFQYHPKLSVQQFLQTGYGLPKLQFLSSTLQFVIDKQAQLKPARSRSRSRSRGVTKDAMTRAHTQSQQKDAITKQPVPRSQSRGRAAGPSTVNHSGGNQKGTSQTRGKGSSTPRSARPTSARRASSRPGSISNPGGKRGLETEVSVIGDNSKDIIQVANVSMEKSVHNTQETSDKEKSYFASSSQDHHYNPHYSVPTQYPHYYHSQQPYVMYEPPHPHHYVPHQQQQPQQQHQQPFVVYPYYMYNVNPSMPGEHYYNHPQQQPHVVQHQLPVVSQQKPVDTTPSTTPAAYTPTTTITSNSNNSSNTNNQDTLTDAIRVLIDSQTRMQEQFQLQSQKVDILDHSFHNTTIIPSNNTHVTAGAAATTVISEPPSVQRRLSNIASPDLPSPTGHKEQNPPIITTTSDIPSTQPFAMDTEALETPLLDQAQLKKKRVSLAAEAPLAQELGFDLSEDSDKDPPMASAGAVNKRKSLNFSVDEFRKSIGNTLLADLASSSSHNPRSSSGQEVQYEPMKACTPLRNSLMSIDNLATKKHPREYHTDCNSNSEEEVEEDEFQQDFFVKPTAPAREPSRDEESVLLMPELLHLSSAPFADEVNPAELCKEEEDVEMDSKQLLQALQDRLKASNILLAQTSSLIQE